MNTAESERRLVDLLSRVREQFGKIRESAKVEHYQALGSIVVLVTSDLPWDTVWTLVYKLEMLINSARNALGLQYGAEFETRAASALSERLMDWADAHPDIPEELLAPVRAKNVYQTDREQWPWKLIEYIKAHPTADISIDCDRTPQCSSPKKARTEM
tara:strand:+ start:209 stop:682 length:474 start_codon:yes stop_codon:yes gene_type:complete